MANLIITVISIALVAVAALMGAHYGGQAYMDGQAKARANELMAKAGQIANAWRMYAVNHGGSYTLSASTLLWYYAPDNNDLVPKYLAQLPIDNYATNQNFPWTYPITTLLQNDASNGSVDANTIVFYYIPESVCKQITQMAQGNTTPVQMAIDSPNTAAIMALLKPFNCIQHMYSGEYRFFYRVF